MNGFSKFSGDNVSLFYISIVILSGPGALPLFILYEWHGRLPNNVIIGISSELVLGCNTSFSFIPFFVTIVEVIVEFFYSMKDEILISYLLSIFI